MKTILSVIISTTLLFNNVVFADQTVYTNGPLLFVIEDDGNIKIIEYFGDKDTVEVPMAIGGYIVTSIASGTFKDKNVKNVKLPNTITSIAADAFDNISDIEIKYYDKDDQYVDMESPIVYGEPEKEIDKPKEESKEPEKHQEQETNEDESIEVVEIEITDAQEDEKSLFEEEDTLQEEIKETIDVNPSVDNKEVNIVENSSNSYIYIGLGLIGVIIVFIIFFRHIKKSK